MSLEPTLGVYKIGPLIFAWGTATPIDAGYSPTLGASIVPFRPNASPNAYDYVFDDLKASKVYIPSSGAPVVQKVGIAEPQSPLDAVVNAQYQQFMGQPFGGSYATAGSATSAIVLPRVNDHVEAVFPDPVNAASQTLHVNPASLTPAVYLASLVSAYFWYSSGENHGQYGRFYPQNPATAAAASQGNSLMFNPPAYNGTEDPNVQPMQWAIIDSTGAIVGGTGGSTTGYFVPWNGATQGYDMSVLCSLYFPAGGEYTLNINHDDGMYFAISGASLVSGPVNDDYNHFRTAVGGYQFANGGIAGNNTQGYNKDTFVISVPAAGVYAMEIDYAQYENEQCLVVLSNGHNIFASSLESYQRDMVIVVGDNTVTVQDVFPPLPGPINIEALYYYAGNTGRCIVVPSQISPGPGTEGVSLYEANLLAGIRRGALVQIGGEVCRVLNTSIGPDGSLCFETITVGTHTAAENIQGVPAILILGSANAGDAITSPAIQFSVQPNAVGTLTIPLPTNPFVSEFFSFQPDDYLHFSVNVDSLENLNEIKFLIDVGDGTFLHDFYFFAVRPNDIAAGVQNNLTQLGVAQLVSQRATIDEEHTAEAGNQAKTASSFQTDPADGAWSEIKWPISEMTRVGNDQTKTLQNANAIQVLVNCSAAVSVITNSASVTGGYQPDVGPTGIPYLYWLRPRSSVTGAKGNASPIMRYGVSPRRQSVYVPLPNSYPDPQVNTWDIFRQGGQLSKILYVGSLPLNAGNFIDNYSDLAIAENDELPGDDYEPFPSIGPPIQATESTIIGTEMTATFPSAASSPAGSGTLTQLQNLLPGNLFNVGQQVYTLWCRPTLISKAPGAQTWLFQFVENADYQVNPQVQLYEPALANQSSQYVWGPDTNGVFFAVGDTLRPGVVSRTNPQNPDSATEAGAVELCAPTEPLQNGCLLGDTSVTASPTRWWAGYPQQNTATPYRWVGIPVGRGLAAPFGICSDGKSVYFVAKDGIYRHNLGVGESLTDADLYNLFPHEGVFPVPYVYGGLTLYPPEYAYSNSFRLAVVNNFLYFNYQDTNQIQRTLVLNLRTGAWTPDVYSPKVTIHATPTSPASLAGVKKQQLFLGDVNGGTDIELSTGGTEQVSCLLATKEEMMGDIRAYKQFGDASLDLTPNGGNVAITPTFLGIPFGQTTLVNGGSAVRTLAVVNLEGQQIERSMGLLLAWMDIGAQTVLFGWQPSFVSQPENIQNRFGDWDNGGALGAKFFQGFLLEADTFGQNKTIGIRNSDTGVLQQTFQINHNGQQEKPYSFAVPFIAHLVRDEPDNIPWRRFNFKYIFEPTPEMVMQWITQPTSHGLAGYQHVKQALFAINAPAPIVFTINIDGVNYPYTVPPTLGYRKVLVPFGPWKGLVFQYSAVSTQPFQIWIDDAECWVKNWGDTGPYKNVKLIGATMGPEAKI
jgi:hypothetical protein